MVKRNISIKGARAGAKDVASRDASAAERKKPRPPAALNGNRSHTGKAENKRHPRIPAVKSHHFEYPNPFSVLDFQGFQGVKGYGFTTSLTGMDVVVCPSPQFMVADVGAEGRSATANVALSPPTSVASTGTIGFNVRVRSSRDSSRSASRRTAPRQDLPRPKRRRARDGAPITDLPDNKPVGYRRRPRRSRDVPKRRRGIGTARVRRGGEPERANLSAG